MDSVRLLEPRTPSRGPAVVAVLLALTIAGCGGSQVEYQEVPGDPAEITLPDRSPAVDSEATETEAEVDAAVEETTPAPTATPAGGDTGAATDGATGDESATVEATPAPVEDGPETDEPPVPGSDAERFEDFCEQNAGAC